MAKKQDIDPPLKRYLGDFAISRETLPGVEAAVKDFTSSSFKKLGERQKSERVNRALLQLIQSAPPPSFTLTAVIDYIDRVCRTGALELYSFAHFELWLNQFSGLSREENYEVRARIVGKWVPRDEYQVLFPLGMGKTYAGSHFVTAHGSPDLDTTIASFWGWVDAFGARVSEGLHLWNLPGGPPLSQIEIKLLFQHLFGESIFEHLVKTRLTLALTGVDMMTQKGLVKKEVGESSLTIDHERNQNAIVLVDEAGFYLGDWRNFDVEGVRQVIMLLSNCLRWFENNLHAKLIALFAKEDLKASDVSTFAQTIFGTRIEEAAPVYEFTARQREHVEAYLGMVLGASKGLLSTFEEFAEAMKKLSLFDFDEFVVLVRDLPSSSLFDHSGYLVESRPRIFHALAKIIAGLDKAIQSVRSFVDRLDVALRIKTHVFGYLPQMVSYRSDIEEIRSKMGTYPYLTVTASDPEGRLIPLGIIHASDMHKPILGTVTLRDFCNREETKIPSYLEVISVIDHHKSALNTFSPPVAWISDAQSSNVLVAELAFAINDRYSTGGMSESEIAKQMGEVLLELQSTSNRRILQRLLQRQMNRDKGKPWFIDPRREFIEYLHFLYAILDDTDLLTKVTLHDVECVAQLLNRLKSLMLQREVEVIQFDDIPRGEQFVARAAARILQNSDMYSLYRKIYLSKEEEVERNLELSSNGEPSSTFVDTKEQNGCCRVGQTKMFARNFPIFYKHIDGLRRNWLKQAQKVNEQHSEIDLHLHMISTIAGAEDLFAGTAGEYPHKDELWIWIPETGPAVEHLKAFLNAFKGLPQLSHNGPEVEFLGENGAQLAELFTESFLPIPAKLTKPAQKLPIAILRFQAGTINSRKAMVSPYLPRLLN